MQQPVRKRPPKPNMLIDATGLTCPIPVLRLQKTLRQLVPASEVTLHATDKMAVIDVPHFCNENGHELLSSETQEGAGPGGMDLLLFHVRKNSAA